MPQIVIIKADGSEDYTTVASWTASSDYSTDWGVGNKATGKISGEIVETATINKVETPNGSLLTANDGEEYDGTNSGTCARLISSETALTLRDNGLEISGFFIQSTGNTTALKVGAFEGIDADIHDIGVKASSNTSSAHSIVTYSAAPFAGNLERIIIEESGGYGLWIRDAATGTIDHITSVDANTSNNGFRDGVRSDDSNNVLTNVFSLISPLSVAAADSFFGSYSPSSDYNAGDDSTAPGANSLDNRSTADLAGYAGGDFRISSSSDLATAGSGGGFIGASLQSDGGPGLTSTITELGPSFGESISATLTAQLSASITESGPSFTDSIDVILTSLTIAAGITEDGPSFTESVGTNILQNIEASTTEQGPLFNESISANIAQDITASATESGPSFNETIIAAMPVTITVNHKNIVRVKRSINSVTIARKSNIKRVR